MLWVRGSIYTAKSFNYMQLLERFESSPAINTASSKSPHCFSIGVTIRSSRSRVQDARKRVFFSQGAKAIRGKPRLLASDGVTACLRKCQPTFHLSLHQRLVFLRMRVDEFQRVRQGGIMLAEGPRERKQDARVTHARVQLHFDRLVLHS